MNFVMHSSKQRFHNYQILDYTAVTGAPNIDKLVKYAALST